MVIENESVELLPACLWICPACDSTNFERMVIAELTPDEKREMMGELDMPIRTGDWVAHPSEVICQHCGTEYRAKG